MTKVLIIEDDDVIAQGMARHLQAAGFDAVGVANGETGLARLRFEHPDVCVLDLMLPGLGGSTLGGAVVALVGALLLAHTAFGFSLSWLKEWWPVAVILFGAYLFIKARMDRPAGPESPDLA